MPPPYITATTVSLINSTCIYRLALFLIFVSIVASQLFLNILNRPIDGLQFGLVVGVQAQKPGFKLKALLSFSQSKFETGCFQSRVSLHLNPPCGASPTHCAPPRVSEASPQCSGASSQKNSPGFKFKALLLQVRPFPQSNFDVAGRWCFQAGVTLHLRPL